MCRWRVLSSVVLSKSSSFAGSARNRALILLVLASLLWSSGGVLIKWVQWHPVAIGGMRSLIAAVVLLLLARLRGPLQFRFDPVTLGIASSYAGTVVLFVIATKLTTAANAILLQYTAPIYVALFGYWLLGERTTAVDWIAIAAVLLGMVLFLYDGLGGGGMLGNGLACISAVCFATTVMLLRQQQGRSSMEAIILGNLLAALIGLPFMFSAPAPDAASWLGMLLLGVFQLGISYWLYVLAVRHVSALEGVLIPVLEPLLSPLWVALWFAERPTPLAIVGGLLVLCAVVLRGVWQALSARAG
jgi:drug/metabolite transporter (DMT)-like permease